MHDDPHLLCVSPRNFAEHLETLKKYSRPIPLRELVQALQDGDLHREAVVVTFDDGYADNLFNAKPLLDHYDVPATVFVATGNIGQQREFWWDELERLILQCGTLPKTLRLKVNGCPYEWKLGEAANYKEDEYLLHRRWNVLEQDNPSSRQRLYRSMCDLLRSLHEGDRRKVLDDLLAWAGVDSKGRPTHRTLTGDELFHLSKGNLIEVGAHTVTHPVLSALPTAAQRAEIQQSKAHLEEILECTVTSFAYPYGSRSDYTAETVAIVKETRFCCACSNFADIVSWHTDRFQLPRLLVRNWDGEAFARRLRKWLSWLSNR